MRSRVTHFEARNIDCCRNLEELDVEGKLPGELALATKLQAMDLSNNR